MEPTLITCTRRLQFCAGPRVMGHESKCAHLHGHNYVVWITASAALDSIGRVIDFSVLKQRVGGWIEDHWDHGFILHERDDAGRAALAGFNACMHRQDGWKGQKMHLLPCNPTAENMAEYLLRTVCPLVLPAEVVAVRVVVQETENCEAEAAL